MKSKFIAEVRIKPYKGIFIDGFVAEGGGSKNVDISESKAIAGLKKILKHRFGCCVKLIRK